MNKAPIAVCSALGLVFVLLAYSAAASKSATYDEPLHVATGWMNLYRGDFRLSPDVPPLWEYWIALPLGKNALAFPENPPKDGLDHQAISSLYQADGIGLVERSRWMGLPIALALAALIAVCAGQLAGNVAAIAALAAFVFDPNWLGHAPLAKNDVAFAAVYFATVYAIWRMGVRPSPLNIAAVILLPAIALGTKLSALLLLPVLLICVVGRAYMDSKIRRPQWAMVWIAAIITAYLGLWAQYQFRFDSGPGGAQLDIPSMVHDLRVAEVRTRLRVDQPTPEQLAAWHPGITTRGVLWLESHRLVPQAWAAGFIYIQSQAGDRAAFLLGETYAGGKWYYFPLAWLFKEPLAIIAMALIAVVRFRGTNRWTLLALGLPAAAYAMMALTATVNVGLRHLFPVFPFIDVAIGVAAARLWQSRHRWIVAALAVALLVETLAAYPDFISFFNYPSGGERGGVGLLGDSNLDWGQDLPLLAQWQKEHSDIPLYLDYFGTCDPAAYGILYVNVLGGYVYGPPPKIPMVPGIAAVSASKLQRLFVMDSRWDFAAQYEHAKPIGVLGGSIYLFRYPPQSQDQERVAIGAADGDR